MIDPETGVGGYIIAGGGNGASIAYGVFGSAASATEYAALFMDVGERATPDQGKVNITQKFLFGAAAKLFGTVSPIFEMFSNIIKVVSECDDIEDRLVILMFSFIATAIMVAVGAFIATLGLFAFILYSILAKFLQSYLSAVVDALFQGRCKE